MKTQISKFMINKTQRITLFAFGLSVMFASCGNKGFKIEPNTQFAVETLQPTSVELKSSYPATIRGKQDVEIRPQVAGFITKLCVDEGAIVREGQPLFIIDQVQYEAAVKQAEAGVEVAKASVATEELTYKNKVELHKKNIISDYELQSAKNTLASKKASLAQADAQLVNARKNLSFTVVTSPSSGIVGNIPYRIGSLVSASSPSPLTTVSEISEMYAYFSLTEKELLNLIRKDAGKKDIEGSFPNVELQLADGSLYGEEGKVQTISGVIDQTTGSVTIRASFPNPNHLLRSGGTGAVLIPYKMENAITVPQKATYEVQDKKFVYVLQPDNTIKNTEIQIFNVDNGKDYVVMSGLKAGDKIVIENVSTLKDGQTIEPITKEQSEQKFKDALNKQN